jgi:hypothetical protein
MGTSTMSLVMHVACKDTAECSSAGGKLYNTTNQAKLTAALASDASVQMLPSTFQVYGANVALRGNEELPKIEAPPPPPVIKMPPLEINFTAPDTLSDFPGLTPPPSPAKGANGTAAPVRKGAAAGAAAAGGVISASDASMFDALDTLTRPPPPPPVNATNATVELVAPPPAPKSAAAPRRGGGGGVAAAAAALLAAAAVLL